MVTVGIVEEYTPDSAAFAYSGVDVQGGFWLPGMIHAIMVVNEYKADQRNRLLVEAMSADKKKE